MDVSMTFTFPSSYIIVFYAIAACGKNVKMKSLLQHNITAICSLLQFNDDYHIVSSENIIQLRWIEKKMKQSTHTRLIGYNRQQWRINIRPTCLHCEPVTYLRNVTISKPSHHAHARSQRALDLQWLLFTYTHTHTHMYTYVIHSYLTLSFFFFF